jgi:hypothetical protein
VKTPSISWQQVALLALLVASIIVAHKFTPGAASAVVSIVDVLIGSFFLGQKNREGGE